jgi:hypothetical protein
MGSVIAIAQAVPDFLSRKMPAGGPQSPGNLQENSVRRRNPLLFRSRTEGII